MASPSTGRTSPTRQPPFSELPLRHAIRRERSPQEQERRKHDHEVSLMSADVITPLVTVYDP